MIFPAVLLLAASLVSATPLLASEDLQPANKSSTSWACPEYRVDFNPGVGNDITYYDNIPSWQECGRLCHVHKTCNNWVWAPPRAEDIHMRCWLKAGDGNAVINGNRIGGDESCYTC